MRQTCGFNWEVREVTRGPCWDQFYSAIKAISPCEGKKVFKNAKGSRPMSPPRYQRNRSETWCARWRAREETAGRREGTTKCREERRWYPSSGKLTEAAERGGTTKIGKHRWSDSADRFTSRHDLSLARARVGGWRLTFELVSRTLGVANADQLRVRDKEEKPRKTERIRE